MEFQFGRRKNGDSYVEQEDCEEACEEVIEALERLSHHYQGT